MAAELPDGAVHVPGIGTFDRQGNPLVLSDGCTNCGAGAGWTAFSTPRPCSRRCQMQIEYAESLRDGNGR